MIKDKTLPDKDKEILWQAAQEVSHEISFEGIDLSPEELMEIMLSMPEQFP